MVRVAIAQMPGSRPDEWPRTCALAEELVTQAAAGGADIVLLPECTWPAYRLGSRADYFAARAAGLPSDQWFLSQARTWARQHRIAVCVGYVAEHTGQLCNSAALISAAGELLATYAKCFLWDFDHELFAAGRELCVAPTEWGALGLMICADARLPEIPATLATRGARLILQPTAWVNVGSDAAPWNPQPELLIPERARELGVPIAAASKWGREGDTSFVGSSLICDATGRVVARCGQRETGIVAADVTPGTPRRAQMTTEQRRRLLGSEPARLPPAAVPPLRIVFLDKTPDLRAASSSIRQAVAAGAATPTLLIARAGLPAHATAHTPGGADWLLLTGPTDGVATLGQVRVAAVRDLDADGFAPIRALALEGVHLVVVFGDNVAVRTLRSRAAENRVFVVQVAATGVAAYDPRGMSAEVAGRLDGRQRVAGCSGELVLDVAKAAEKELAPRTNPFTDRTPAAYEF